MFCYIPQILCCIFIFLQLKIVFNFSWYFFPLIYGLSMCVFISKYLSIFRMSFWEHSLYNLYFFRFVNVDWPRIWSILPNRHLGCMCPEDIVFCCFWLECSIIVSYVNLIILCRPYKFLLIFCLLCYYLLREEC